MGTKDDKRVRVLIVEDSPIYREALEGNLNTRPELFEIVGCVDQQEPALSLVERHVPDVVLLDLVLFRDRKAGVEIIYKVRQISPATQIVVLTAYFDDDLIFDAIRAGAVTYLLKDKVTGNQLASILTSVQNGEPPIDVEIARRLYRFFQSPENGSGEIPKMSQLTKREGEVLKLVAEGKTNREIAAELVISIKTVKTHVSNILSKLHLSNRTELTWWYRRQRIEFRINPEDD